MKQMVSILLLVALCHAADSSKSRREEEDNTAKRQLQEGNFGVRIQPSIEASFPGSQVGYEGNKNELREGIPQREYGPPRQPAVKISDALTGQGPSVPAAIQSHLYSPVQIYQPMLGSPTTFEVSQPVPSQLAYSEHKIYQAAPTLQNLNGNQPQQVQVQPAFGQLQPLLPPRPDLPNEFLPRLVGPTLPPNQAFPQRIYQQVFSEQNGVIPEDIFQQINQLGSQMNFDEGLQTSQRYDERVNEGSNNAEQQLDQRTGIQYANRAHGAEQESEQQGQDINEQNRNSEQQSSSTEQPQAVSYASFSRGLPPSSQSQYQSQQDQIQSSPNLPQQRQELRQPQSPPLFQPTQTTVAKQQSSFQPIGTTPLPQTTIYTTVNQTPHRIGIVKIRQRPESTTPEPFTVSTAEPEASSTSISTVVTSNENSLPPIQRQTETTKFSTPASRTRPIFRSFSRPTFAPRTTQQSTFQSLRPFGSRPTTSPLFRRRTTFQSYSTLPSSSFPPEAETLRTSPPEPAVETISSLPAQPVTETSSSLPQQISIQTVASSTPQPQVIQSTLTPIPLFTPEQIRPVSFQPQFSTTLQPLQSLSTLQPVPITQPLPLPSSLQPNTPEVTPVPVQSQSYEVRSEPQSVIQVNEYKSDEKLQQQFLQPLQYQPQLQTQLQFNQGREQIQQQLQFIQQQLQFLQQQPFIQQQQQPQPVQIIQQQSSPLPQPIQFVQQQQPLPQQPVQLVQQQPQLIQQQPQLITPQPQSFTPQPQLLTPQSQLITPKPQFIQQQPQLNPPQSQLFQQQPLLVQPQPQPVPLQPQLIQQQSQFISTPQPQQQLIQSQPQLISTPQPQIPSVQPQPQLIPTPQPQLNLVQPQPQLIPTPQPQLQLVQPQPQLIPTPQPQFQLIEPQPQLIRTPPQPIQIIQQNKPSPQPQTETLQNGQQEQQNDAQKKEKSEKLEESESKKASEDEAFYNQLLQNNIYPESLYASIHPQPLFPVPVGFPSYAAVTPLPALHSPLAPLHSTHIHSPHLHSPSLHGHYHSPHSFPSLQYYGKHANGIFGGGWR